MKACPCPVGIVVGFTQRDYRPIASQSRSFRYVVSLRWNIAIADASTDTAAEGMNSFGVNLSVHRIVISARFVDSWLLRSSARVLRLSYFT